MPAKKPKKGAKTRKAAPKKKAKAAKKPKAKKAARPKARPKARPPGPGGAQVSERPWAVPVETGQPHELPWRIPLQGESKIGVVDDFYGHISVIALTLEQALSVGERIHVRGHTTDLTQAVESMQIGHQAAPSAEAGAAVGIKVIEKCRKGDYVYKVTG